MHKPEWCHSVHHQGSRDWRPLLDVPEMSCRQIKKLFAQPDMGWIGIRARVPHCRQGEIGEIEGQVVDVELGSVPGQKPAR